MKPNPSRTTKRALLTALRPAGNFLQGPGIAGRASETGVSDAAQILYFAHDHVPAGQCGASVGHAGHHQVQAAPGGVSRTTRTMALGHTSWSSRKPTCST